MHNKMWYAFMLSASLATIGASGKIAADTGRRSMAQCPGLALPSNDEAAELQKCLDHLPAASVLALTPRIYVLHAPITINQRVTITSAGVGATAQGCSPNIDNRCATLVLAAMHGAIPLDRMPLEIAKAGVSLRHLRVQGSRGADKAYDQRVCLNEQTRPMGGGIRVRASNFTFSGSAIRGVACYTAMEVRAGADHLRVIDSLFWENGDHQTPLMWADGLTVHEAKDATITRNLFRDNTDVQLIFGGCARCRISHNSFTHSEGFGGASFAELMLQSWPTTSGDFSGSLISENAINCSPTKRCGYGIMIGSSPWYAGRATGGEVSRNTVRFAMIGLNVDRLTGPMVIRDNTIAESGGRYSSACGTKDWPALNTAPLSKKFTLGMPTGTGVSTQGCLLNQHPN
ncbi:right-handed parallel beta-helix repeat-containing protein [Sphingomonas sp. AAP5]|uniref:right-handed parallel beta-helix repeat-containing protein n=1 Tax=Sphingomonas sp. AAP5 TaxID=1523415 RepID=UPI0010573AB1|nr:right-handed parallel beta-helix repeat-containing protein [Sphingomonas sp. AAP5]QBM76826.1 right-handed parallel beta-helix repeat-containing protein [Sphingomonas sp. AAP5]